MRRLASVLFVGTVAFAASAQLPDLLEGALPEDVFQDSKTTFYNVWQPYYLDGEDVPVTMMPNSVFSKIFASDNALCFMYEENPHNVPGNSSNGFTEDMTVMVLEFPKDAYSYDFSGFCYTFPITVQEEGEYLLTGSATCLTNNDLKGQAKSFVNTASMLVFVGDKRRCQKTMTVENDGTRNYLAVRDNDGNLFPCAYTPVPPYKAGDNTLPFSLTMELTKDTKYFTIYGPMQQILIGNLHLRPTFVSSGDNVIIEPATEQEICVYTLQGVQTTIDSAREAGGIYITRSGAKSGKVRY